MGNMPEIFSQDALENQEAAPDNLLEEKGLPEGENQLMDDALESQEGAPDDLLKETKHA